MASCDVHVKSQIYPCFTLAGESLFLVLGLKRFLSWNFDRHFTLPTQMPNLIHPTKSALVIVLLNGIYSESIGHRLYFVKIKDYIANIPNVWNGFGVRVLH